MKQFTPDIIEILDGWTKAEIDKEIARFQKALELYDQWESFTEDEKDEIFERNT